MKTETTKKSIPVSNLTLSLWLGYVKQAAIDAGIVEEVKMNDPVWGEHIELHTDAAVADDIAHCMYCSCMGQSYHDLTHEEIVRAEAEGMLYQLEVTAKYDLHHTAEAIKALRKALADLLTGEQMGSEPEAMPTWSEAEHNRKEQRGEYDYHQAILEDVIEYIRGEVDASEYEDRDALEEALNDELWTVDSVTGNGSGSYTFNRAKAREYVTGNLDLVQEMASDFCIGHDELGKHFMEDDWEWFDVSIRCNLLSWAIGYALDWLESDDRRQPLQYGAGVEVAF